MFMLMSAKCVWVHIAARKRCLELELQVRLLGTKENVGPLEEQQVIFTAEVTLWPPENSYKWASTQLVL